MLAEREVLEDQFAVAAAGQRQSATENNDDFQHASILAAYEERSNRARSRPGFGEGQGLRRDAAVNPSRFELSRYSPRSLSDWKTRLCMNL